MKDYIPEKMVADSRFQKYFPTLDQKIQKEVHARMAELIEEEKIYCDKGNYKHMCQIITALALYEVLQKNGRSEEEAYWLVSTEMWKFLDPGKMQKASRLKIFLPLMKKIIPLGFKFGSGYGWRYTWHDDDPADEYHFECNECIYEKIFGKRNLLKLGSIFCHADIINYGSLPYIDFIRTQTLCQGGTMCDFRFVRHETEAGRGWKHTDSI